MYNLKYLEHNKKHNRFIVDNKISKIVPGIHLNHLYTCILYENLGIYSIYSTLIMSFCMFFFLNIIMYLYTCLYK